MNELNLMPGAWVEQAECRGDEYPNAWHPGTNKEEAAALTRYARRKCAVCPVRNQCLEFALELGTTKAQGIWGNTSEFERHQLLKKKRRAAA